jgi:tetratricopeptide (TPR) repeat protein
MHRAEKTSRVLIDLSSDSELADSKSLICRDRLLHNLVASRLAAHAANSGEFFGRLVDRLIRLAEHALSLRDMGTLEAVSLALMNLPIVNAKQIGQYYKALVINRNGQKYEALSLLEIVADEGPLRYRARAIQSMGGVHHELGRPGEALRLYPDAIRALSAANIRDPLTALLVHLEVTCIKSETGDHRGALADYERLSPLVQTVARQNPLYFYFYHNELAVELVESGRIAEAEGACAIALASPFASAYPEWSETRDEIAAKRKAASPSVVAIHRVLEDSRTTEVDRTHETDRTHEAHRATEAERIDNAHSATAAERASEAALATQAQSQRQPRPFSAFAFSSQASNKDFFQRSVIKFPAKTITALNNAASILDRVLICVGPRAPPSLS